MQQAETHDWRTSSAQEPRIAAQFPAVIEGELCEGAPYSGAQLAGELAIAESTLRTRWLPWLERVAPVELLRTEAGYTDLARSLVLEFKQVPSRKAAREKWVAEAKQRYSREFSLDGLVGPGVCGELGNALALVRQQGSQMQLSATPGFEQLKDLIGQQSKVQADFDAAEVAAMRARGLNRGVQRFQIEVEAEDSAYFELRRLRSQAGQVEGPQSA
ncbi:hypothetical protein IQ265_09260 [Nodosilinea sp. LEGE 06152]|uniref:hypothetical protein n=1 Tax=Nodosilinea sp. LEGE 06152 TaxID=2777966 RepID=UPI00188163ED|nr:hypothetical protein [Nodosilinea sp. LEGE 06152]MBE9157011.1 hypothetical protein [Nodosilinea sp. LEGE 06152]